MPSSREKLIEYLLVCFDAGEMRRLLRVLPDGDVLSHQLPGPTASARDVATEVVAVLAKTDLLIAEEFWATVKRERPRRVQEIEALRKELTALRSELATLRPAGAQGKLRVLLVSASPIQGAKLRVDEEFARILAELRRCTNLEIEQRTAVTFDRLRQALLDYGTPASASQRLDRSPVVSGPARSRLVGLTPAAQATDRRRRRDHATTSPLAGRGDRLRTGERVLHH